MRWIQDEPRGGAARRTPRNGLVAETFWFLLAALAAPSSSAHAQPDRRVCGQQAQSCVMQCRQQPAQMQGCLNACGEAERACRADAAAQNASASEVSSKQALTQPLTREQVAGLAQQFFDNGDRVQLARRASQSLDMDLARVRNMNDRESRLRELMGTYSYFLGADLQVSQARADADPALVITRAMRLKIEAEATSQGSTQASASPGASDSACSMPGKTPAELISSMRSTLESVERELDQVTGRRFLELNDDVFLPQLECLMAVARKQLTSIPTGLGGAARFAQWDAEVGGPAMLLARRWAHIPSRRLWGLQTWTQFSDKDGGAGYWRDLLGHAAPKAELPSEELRLAIDKRTPAIKPSAVGTMVPVLTPEAKRPRPAPEPIVIIATPRTLGLAIAAAQLGRGVGGLIAHIANQRREYAQLEERVKSSREDFWRCQYGRCNSLESKQVAFVESLMLKDLFLLKTPAAAAFDGGLVPGCQREFVTVKESAGDFLQINPEQDPAAWEQSAKALFSGKSYAAWQSCRDRSEYILRPRPTLLR